MVLCAMVVVLLVIVISKPFNKNGDFKTSM
jgi:hypothetical protein